LVKIYCTSCDNPKKVEIDYLKRGKFITCEKCEESFNLFTVYEFLYNNITIAKKIVDVLCSAVFGKPQLTGNSDDMKIIDHFCKVSDFDSLLYDVVFDTILFGNAFLEKTREEDFLRRINPATVEIKASFQQRPPFKAFYEEIDKLMQHTPVIREIDQSKFFHFLGNPSNEPFGDSVLGFWFNDWYKIVFSMNKANVDWTKATVIRAAGIPVHFIFPEMEVDSLRLRLFPSRINRRRRQISRVIEREILPMVLGKSYIRETSPKFEIV
jgi:hypothetical protein